MPDLTKENQEEVPSVGDRIIQGLTEFRDALKHKEPLHKRFTIRTVELDLEPRKYPGQKVLELREQLRVSQAVFAKLLAVSVHAVRAWEQGKRRPPKIACRLMDEMAADPDRWVRRLTQRPTEKLA
jgi:putative transcriptional regulator